MHRQRACRKEPARGSPLGRYAGRPRLTPGLKLEIRPYRADARSVSSSTPPANEGDVARVGGLDRCHVAGRNRSTFPGAWDEANVRYPPLIGHGGPAARRRGAAQWAQGIGLPISHNFTAKPYALRSWTTAMSSSAPHGS